MSERETVGWVVKDEDDYLAGIKLWSLGVDWDMSAERSGAQVFEDRDGAEETARVLNYMLKPHNPEWDWRVVRVTRKVKA